MSVRLEPPSPPKEMFAGLVGELVELYAGVTEAAPAAIALQFLVSFGNAAGRQAHFMVAETRHALNENLLIVGRSARSRKGDSQNITARVFREIDPEWTKRVATGLSSGEGLISSVRDPVVKLDKDGTPVVVDEGVADKRLLVFEPEFSGPLKMFRREGNVLCDVLRQAWDGREQLRMLVRKSPDVATQAHISITGHTTPEDLRAHLSDLDAANGLGNRFLFALVDRVGEIPDPPRVAAAPFAAFVARVRAALTVARSVDMLERTPDARALWREFYPMLTADEPGLIGKLLSRSEAHTARLSALFALLAGRGEIAAEHLLSAAATWHYSADSARRIFAGRTGNDVADRLKAEIAPGQSMTFSEIREEIFAKHISAARLRDGVDLLISIGEFRLGTRATAGRSATVLTRLDRSHGEQGA